MSFQDNLRSYRESNNLSAKQLVEKLGITYSTYMGYENQGKEPKYELLCKIAYELGTSIDDLLGYRPPSHKSFEYYSDMIEDISEIYTPMSASIGEDGRIYITSGYELYNCSFDTKEDFIKFMEMAEHSAMESDKYLQALNDTIADLVEIRYYEEQAASNLVDHTIDFVQRAISEATTPEERGKLKQALKKALSELESSE